MKGKWEAVVKTVKFYLRRTINESLLALEKTFTLLTQIEIILNSRALEPLHEDPENLTALITENLLIGKPLILVLSPSLLDLAEI